MKLNKILAAMSVAVICGFNSFDACAQRGSVKTTKKADTRGVTNKSSNSSSSSSSSKSSSSSSSKNSSSASKNNSSTNKNSHITPAKPHVEPAKPHVTPAKPVVNTMQRAPQSHLDGHHTATTHFAPVVRHTGTKHVYHHKIDSRARVFYIDNSPYYTYNGIYYRYVPGYGYEEIFMPENIIVSDLPYGANRVYVNGYRYYEADGMWFQPVVGGFLIVAPPVRTSAVYVAKPTYYYSATFGF